MLVRATAAEEMDMKTGNTGKKDAEGRECLKWDGDEETWKWKVKTLKGPGEKREMGNERKGS